MINDMRPTVHPNLKRDYFHDINTKDKAYWLGFLYADGFLKTGKYGPSQICFKLSVKDENMVFKFISALGLNDEKIEYVSESNCYCIRFGCVKMIADLIHHGCVPRKSKIIELPTLNSRELYLAFILGFYDGDGQQKTTRIICGSRKFLEQIKEMFILSFIIQDKERSHALGNRMVVGKAFEMNLGADLFNEMMENYQDSMPRKRKHFCTKEERGRLAAQASKHYDGKPKIAITREELERLVWEKSTTEIAKELGVSDTAIAKRCKSFGIEKPGRGYWAKQYSINK